MSYEGLHSRMFEGLRSSHYEFYGRRGSALLTELCWTGYKYTPLYSDLDFSKTIPKPVRQDATTPYLAANAANIPSSVDSWGVWGYSSNEYDQGPVISPASLVPPTHILARDELVRSDFMTDTWGTLPSDVNAWKGILASGFFYFPNPVQRTGPGISDLKWANTVRGFKTWLRIGIESRQAWIAQADLYVTSDAGNYGWNVWGTNGDPLWAGYPNGYWPLTFKSFRVRNPVLIRRLTLTGRPGHIGADGGVNWDQPDDGVSYWQVIDMPALMADNQGNEYSGSVEDGCIGRINFLVYHETTAQWSARTGIQIQGG